MNAIVQPPAPHSSHAPRPPTQRPSIDAPWSRWHAHFAGRTDRPLPEAEDLRAVLPPSAHGPLLDALVRFQAGECGEGRIAGEIRRASLPDIDDHYRDALGLFIREEGRHARLLAATVKRSGRALATDTWTRRVFTVGRRVAGPRVELVALMAAEIVGIAFYAAVAERLPDGATRRTLAAIAEDERSHLDFHVAFFRRQCRMDPVFRRAFPTLWFGAVGAGASLMVVDNRYALTALDIDPIGLWRWQLDRAREAAARIRS